MKFILLDNMYDLSDIKSISNILKPSTSEFDDSGRSGHNEIDWMYRIIVSFKGSGSVIITKYDLEDSKYNTLEELHSALSDFWLNPNKYLPTF